jgi:hypothetical protein
MRMNHQNNTNRKTETKIAKKQERINSKNKREKKNKQRK